ncbi:hypothetical protein P7228_06315 [Altererythrobacter arenosus]|uniref:DUF1090 family protein n=1 Tax=Altererythrobacter arenosus TaxID=3032592 RepID=A0ABY8FUK0_9SPHN|nr:hypothetical protein [Altererythrobacter sp. CAU 1644]WFL78675.1 hypothetical protein P7228_06315 [Altererythrobacter sp. CAU 1644]
MRGLALSTLALVSLALPGCIVRTAADVVTAPVKIASKTVDLATTSQSEADEKRGRELRKREERLGKLERAYDKQMKECADGNRRSCDQARETHRQIQVLLPSIPVEPEED